MDGLIQDLRYAMRTLIRNPGFSAVAAATVALGIGANTAIFSVVDGIMLRSLPYPEPDRLVAVWADYTRRDGPLREWLSYPNFDDLRDQDQVFDELGVYQGWIATLASEGGAERLIGAQITQGMFSRVLGIGPALGRGFLPEDDRPGAPGVVVLSHGLWQRAFGGDSSVIGRTLSFDSGPHTVVGVMPADFEPPFIRVAELWRPLGPNLGRRLESRGSAILRSVGRLRSGVSLESARQEATALARRLESEHPEANTGVGYTLFSLREDLADPVSTALWVLLGAVGFILLIACVNVANLLLSRGASRTAEFALRASLGAGGKRLARQLLTESTVLAMSGALVGVILAYWGTRGLKALAPGGIPRLDAVAVDGRVLAFTAAITLLAGLAFGALPALKAARPDLMASLKEGGRGADSGGRARRLQKTLVAGQVALALMLLVGAGLLIRTFSELRSVDLGFETEDRLTVRLNLPRDRYPERAQRVSFYTRLLERLEAIPGVEGAAAINSVPMMGNDGDVGFNIEGRPIPAPGEESPVWIRRITPAYFEVMGIDLVDGRPFDTGDDGEATRVVIINQTMARRFFADGDPVGQRINLNDPENPVWRQIVGIARNVKNFGVRGESRNALYLPYEQVPSLVMSLVLETGLPPEAAIPAVRSQVAEMDAQLATSQLVSLESIVKANLASERFVTVLLAMFAALALILASVGLYGVVSYGVQQRLREMGIRMALGAEAREIVRLVITGVLTTVAAGIVAGLAGAFFLARLMERLLYGVSPSDPLVFAGVAALLAIVAVAASSIPARRASRLNAMNVIRWE